MVHGRTAFGGRAHGKLGTARPARGLLALLDHVEGRSILSAGKNIEWAAWCNDLKLGWYAVDSRIGTEV